MVGDVSERLLHEPIDGRLELGYQTLLGLRGIRKLQLAVHFDGALCGVAPDQGLDRGSETKVIECRRAQLAHDRMDALDLGLEAGHELIKHRRYLLGIDLVARSRGEHLQSTERVKCLVVELARPVPTLRLSRLERIAEP